MENILIVIKKKNLKILRNYPFRGTLSLRQCFYKMSVGRAALIGGKKCNEYFWSWTLSNHEVFYDIKLSSGPSLLPCILIYGALINKRQHSWVAWLQSCTTNTGYAVTAELMLGQQIFPILHPQIPTENFQLILIIQSVPNIGLAFILFRA